MIRNAGWVLLVALCAVSPARSDETEKWWASTPPIRPAVPRIDHRGWVQNPIDAFVYRKLREKNLSPAPQADRRTFIRRISFDLLGLPPTPVEIQTFLDDKGPKPYEKLVDRMLDSDRYGERWARHWLDLVRYADTAGFNRDLLRPNAWRYRDYVIRSLNGNKPYNRFVQEQIAGDEMFPDSFDARIATGFMRHGVYEITNRDARYQWNMILNEITDVTGDVFLGVGMQCARCHDHKYDPILQKDYYGLQAFFAPMVWRDDFSVASGKHRAKHARQMAAWESKTKAIRDEIAKIEKKRRADLLKDLVNKFPVDVQAQWNRKPEERNSHDWQMVYQILVQQVHYAKNDVAKGIMGEVAKRRTELIKKLKEFDKLKPLPLAMAPCVTDAPGTVAPIRIGGVKEGPVIDPGYLSVFGNGVPEIKAGKGTSGRRTALAKWFTRPDHPLTTRVIVNRIWQYHFGRGIVATSSDFGHLGARPTHPELLDWLATTFVKSGWRIKALHRMICKSATYRQASVHPEAETLAKIDPTNDFLWRANVKRLQSEQVRDAMLSISGELNRSVGGPPRDFKQPCRSIYIKSRRKNVEPFMRSFDAPDACKSVPERARTTTSTQALMLFNGSFVSNRAMALARRLVKAKPESIEALVQSAFDLAWGGPPDGETLKTTMTFMEKLDPSKLKGDEPALVDFCHVLFNANSFLYVE